MNNNPYAPPLAAVTDLADDGAGSRRSKIAVTVAVNAGVLAAFILFAAINGVLRQGAQNISLGSLVTLICFGALVLAMAIGLFRQRRWAAILWCLLSGLFATITLLVMLSRNRVAYVPLVLLAIQFSGSLLGLWALSNRQGSSVTPASMN